MRYNTLKFDTKERSHMDNKERALLAVKALKQEYPDAPCSLTYTDPFELLVATRLAAQCTDKRVNMVTPALFRRFPNPKAFAEADVAQVEEYIRTCGLYKTKARDLVNLGKALCDRFDGQVPDTMEDLVSLPGIGRKTANLVLGDIFHKPAVVVDTHCIRLTARLGLHQMKDPVKIERLLKEILPPEESNDFCHRLVLHGRAVCDARNPQCSLCCMHAFCEYAQSRAQKAETPAGSTPAKK